MSLVPAVGPRAWADILVEVSAQRAASKRSAKEAREREFRVARLNAAQSLMDEAYVDGLPGGGVLHPVDMSLDEGMYLIRGLKSREGLRSVLRSIVIPEVRCMH